MIWRSTTVRFAALVFLFQALAAAILLFGLGAVLRSQSNADAVAVAEAVRDDLVETYTDGGPAALAKAVEMHAGRQRKRTVVLLLTDPDGKPLAGNLTALPPGLAVDAPYTLIRSRRTGHSLPEAMFVHAMRLSGGETLITGTVVEGERQFFALLERASLIALCLSLLFAAFAAFVSTRLILNRLKATVATLHGVREGDMSRRVPRDGTGDAFALLGDEVNRTLDRVETLNTELKVATDGLAHDLKSPLTRMRSALDRAASAVTDPSAQTAVDQALAESERLMAMIETALSITRAEAGLGRDSFARTDLRDMLDTIAEIYAPLIEDQDRAIVVEAPVSFTMPVHRQLMDQAIGNLVDNALKYGAGTITLSLVPGPARVTLAVADEGPGIAPEQRAEALRRFGRLDEARRGWGAGLGLSLVQAVAHLHGGTVALNDAGPGLAVAIELPL
ncbi:sensor histidine kinase [Novosphingobium naphthalenivorans]|uniref:sensor histidine kinase n=1 Tax=Novosphingobium naphthalenivorans TaxID=273168 RepID=UPI000831943E|nr:HAMP domain-containing sensor histidine kinase [Novosphingobium naphthalenivorans]